MKTVITKENIYAKQFLVEAIYKGHHIRCFTKWDGLEILDEHTEEEAAGIERGLGSFSGSFPMPFHYDQLVDILLKRIAKDPNSRIIESNEFEFQYYPQDIHGA